MVLYRIYDARASWPPSFRPADPTDHD